MIERTQKQSKNLLEFWQTAQIDNSPCNSYASIDISAIKNEKIVNAIKSTLTYDCGKYLAFYQSDFNVLLERVAQC